jgi:hypothetical protein
VHLNLLFMESGATTCTPVGLVFILDKIRAFFVIGKGFGSGFVESGSGSSVL